MDARPATISLSPSSPDGDRPDALRGGAAALFRDFRSRLTGSGAACVGATTAKAATCAFVGWLHV
jgi:hypothetical protein